MAIQGLSVTEISKHYGVTTGAISQLLKPLRDEIQGYLVFKRDPAALYEWQEYRILNSLTDDDIKKMGGYQKVGSSSLIRDKVRLERGQATSINMSANLDLTETTYKSMLGSKYASSQNSKNVSNQDHSDNFQEVEKITDNNELTECHLSDMVFGSDYNYTENGELNILNKDAGVDIIKDNSECADPIPTVKRRPGRPKGSGTKTRGGRGR